MKQKDVMSFIKKHYLLSNLVGMALVVLIVFLSVVYGIDWYTNHGEEQKIPDVVNKPYDVAEAELEEKGFDICVSDTGYVKNLKPGCILDQVPQAGIMAKSGHTIFVVINAKSSPSISLPDIIDNSSQREAEAKLKSMGFKVLPAKTISGEKEWVYGVEYRGRSLMTGEKIPSGAELRVVVGDGVFDLYESSDTLDAIDDGIIEEGGETDDFEVVS